MHELPLTESAALKELLQWLQSKPLWMQEAARRLLLNDVLTETDIEDLKSLCRNPPCDAVRITEEDIARVSASGHSVQLNSLSGLKNINALVDDQELSFATFGMTVIYGDNGSGKSGYVRVLKDACRTRGKPSSILPNLEDIGTDVPQEATIRFTSRDVQQQFCWSPDAKPNEDLHNISIFDSRSLLHRLRGYRARPGA